MRIIITGGTGLIGSALCRDLSEHELIVLSRSPERHAGRLPGNVELLAWDAKTPSGWGDRVDGADAVINLAGAGIADKRWSEARKQLLYSSRIDAGKAVAAAIDAAQNKPGVLLQSSAVGIYGGQTSMGQPKPEDSPPGDDFLARLCKDWEASSAAVEAMGVRRAILRTGVVLSMAGGAFPKMLLPFKLFAGGPVGSGKQPLPWIHMDDAVGAIRYLLEHDSASGPFNLVAPELVDNAGFSKTIGRVMRRPAFMPAPGFAMRLAFGEMADVLLEGQPAQPQRLHELGFQFEHASAESALRDLL